MIDREKLIEREAIKYCLDLYFNNLGDESDDHVLNSQECKDWIAGINSDLNKKLRELDVVCGKIQALENIGYIDPTTYIYSKVQNDIKELESQREQIINSLNELK